MKRMGKAVWNPNAVTIISDHYTPPANATQAGIVKFTRKWAAEYGIEHYYEYAGPCHQVMVEKGRVLPGELVIGTDSHTCMYGALGAFSTGVGSTEMLGVLVTGEIWLKVPESILFTLRGRLPPYLMAKDLILGVIGKVGHNGATYKVMEFDGEAVKGLSMDERLCITNMAVETGAKNGIIACDEKTGEYLCSIGAQGGQWFRSDANATYFAKQDFDVTKMEPLVACPHEVDNVTEIKNANAGIDQAYIGSCTGGRYNDLKVEADLIKGKKIAKGVRLLVSPASREIWDKACKDGILATLSDAGATVLASSCGACLGIHSGAMADGEVCISATNRNFVGRMGSKDADIYLASPLSVTAAALTGKITDPREVM
jgi:3-isopropylmalate/(R)-2-methylmalate dehydratase large subunit